MGALLLKTVADPDLWGHLAFGRLILTEGPPRTDPFGYTAPATAWVNHEWLSEVVMFATYDAFGPMGLVALKVACLAAMVGILLRVLHEAGGGIASASVTVVLLVAGGLASFVTVRPQMFTFPFFSFALWAIARADRGKPGLLWLTPPLTALWSNLHGGVAVGLAVLFFWGGVRLLQVVAQGLSPGLPALLRENTPSRRVSIAIAAVLFLQLPAALATPYGTSLWGFVTQTLQSGLPEISEWKSPLIAAELTDTVGLAALAMLAGLVVSSRGSLRDPLHLLMIGVLAAAALSARRHLCVALIGTAVLGAPSLARSFGRLDRPRSGRPNALNVVIVVIAAAVFAWGLQQSRCVRTDVNEVPRQTVAYLESADARGNLFILFDWGMYAIWHLGPRLKVSIDGRATSRYPPSALRDHLAFLGAKPGWESQLAGTDLALLSPRFQVYERLAAEPGWRVAFKDDVAGVFVRRGSPADAALARTPPPATTAGSGVCLGRSGEGQ